MFLNTLSGNKDLKGKFFYFAADPPYFKKYGRSLILSLKKHAPWSNIHCHLYNPFKIDLIWCDTVGISTSHEFFDAGHREFKALCACIRFIRIPEIFNNSARIISLDCDSIAIKNIPEEEFVKDTIISKVFVRKTGYPLASSISFGHDDARNIFSNDLKNEFKKNNIYWYLDQHLLQNLVQQGSFLPMDGKWSDYEFTDNGFIWAAKGDRKYSKKYISKIKIPKGK